MSSNLAPRKPPDLLTDHRAARTHRLLRQLEEGLGQGGRPLTTSEVAEVIGMSATFVRNEINTGHLRAVLIGRGRRRVYRISVREVERYAKELGIL